MEGGKRGIKPAQELREVRDGQRELREIMSSGYKPVACNCLFLSLQHEVSSKEIRFRKAIA